MKKLLLTFLFLGIALSCSAKENEIPAGYVKLHSGAVVPIEDLHPASGKYLDIDKTPNDVYSTHPTNYDPRKEDVKPKVTGFFGRGFKFFNVNMGNFNFGISK